MTTNKCRRNRFREKPQFGKNQWMLKPVWWETGYSHGLKNFFVSCFLITKGKTVTLSGRYDLTQEIKVNINKNEANWHHVPLIWCTEKNATFTSAEFLLKTHYLTLIMRTHQKNSNWRTLYKITYMYSSKMSRSHERQRLRNGHRLKSINRRNNQM